jgi:GNAT superfamily N-acetyltransferase
VPCTQAVLSATKLIKNWVLAFEAAALAQRVHWFGARTEGMLVARDSGGTIAGTLLLQGPGANRVLAPMLGPAAGTIGCVGVAPPLHGRGIGTALVIRDSQLLSQAGTRACDIGRAASESFYRRVRATSRGGGTPCSTARPSHGPAIARGAVRYTRPARCENLRAHL